jgi:hypothetical protein
MEGGVAARVAQRRAWSVRRTSLTRDPTFLGRMKKGPPWATHQCYSSLATSPIPTTMSFPLSIRHTAMVHKAPVTTNLSDV